MRFATIDTGSGAPVPAIVSPGGTPVRLHDAFAVAGLDRASAPASIRELIERQDELAPVLSRLSAAWAKGEPAMREGLRWLPPVPNPSKILGCAINNASLNNLARVHTTQPPFFVKLPSSLIGHGEPIVIRPDYGLTHPEGELAVVIGRRASKVAVADVPEVVFGYTILNDITSITLKSEDTYIFDNPGIDPPPPGFEHGDMHLVYHARSKGTDGFGPCGPWLVTRDEIPDANALDVDVWMGDELCASDSTGNLRFSVAEVISWLSHYVTLEPGDLVHMGTAARGKYGLRELDFQVWDGPCAVEISGIGRLSNPIVREDLDGNPVPAKPRSETRAWPPATSAAGGRT